MLEVAAQMRHATTAGVTDRLGARFLRRDLREVYRADEVTRVWDRERGQAFTNIHANRFVGHHF